MALKLALRGIERRVVHPLGINKASRKYGYIFSSRFLN